LRRSDEGGRESMHCFTTRTGTVIDDVNEVVGFRSAEREKVGNEATGRGEKERRWRRRDESRAEGSLHDTDVKFAEPVRPPLRCTV
jgi:hypothetical protein